MRDMLCLQFGLLFSQLRCRRVAPLQTVLEMFVHDATRK